MRTRAVILSKNEARISEIDIDEPKRDEVLIETKACGICMSEVHVFEGRLPGGQLAGHEGAGVVIEVGEEVDSVKPGDKVTTLGGPAFADLYKTSKQNVAKIPENVEDLAYWVSEPLACVVNGIRSSEIQVAENVCIVGCGYMGLLMIQAMPKTIINNLIALDIRSERLKLAKEFGADFTLNPREVEAVKEAHDIIGGEADVVIEASGTPGTLNLATKLVRKGGKLVVFGYHAEDEVLPTGEWHVKGLKILNTSPSFSTNFGKDFHDAVKLLKKGMFDQRQLITHRFSLEDIEEAFKTASEKPVNYIKGVVTF
ncbi:MAG: zinc-binding dehydrogenase [Thermoproteota archaeon]